MRNCILLDFDGTITTRDTTRFLLRELLRLRPWRFFAMFPHIIRLIFVSEGHEVQRTKNRAISALLCGLTPELLLPAIQRYRQAVQALLRPRLLEVIRQHVANGEVVLVVTASADFAIRHALAGELVEVIGTKFCLANGHYSGEVIGVGCYGLAKPEFIDAWEKANGIQHRFVEAWSDAESDLPMMLLAPVRYWVPPLGKVNRIREIDPEGKIIEC